jgi:hypothetical protein
MRRREFITPLGDYGEPCPLQRLRGRGACAAWRVSAASSLHHLTQRGVHFATFDADGSVPPRINSRLCPVGGLDADGWEFPPHPK